MEWIWSIFLEVIKSFGVPYINHHRKLEDYMNELQRNANRLNARKRDLESKAEAELRCRKKLKIEVQNWFNDVQEVDNEVKNIEEKFHSVPYVLRGRLGNVVCQKIEKVKQICQQGTFLTCVAVDGPPATGVKLPTPKLEGEMDAKEQIWKYLMGVEVGMIGVCGMGGIGKTTIMKHINNQLLEEQKKNNNNQLLEDNRFDHVIWVTVSKNLNIFQLQKVVADSLKESLPEDELQQRAATLKSILEGKRYVLILDDVWRRFPLLEVGIPEPTLGMRRKIVLTSRLIEVCGSKGCGVVKVQPLSKEESMNLFLDHVGHSVVQDQKLKGIVNKIVDQCGGLPLSIVTIAGSMKGVDDICEWRNTLAELENCVKSVKEWDIKIFEQLKLSYDQLKDPNIKNCFLHCSLYPEDFVIERLELIESWIDEGLLGLGTKEAMHDRGQSILNKLEDFFLLERATIVSYPIDKEAVKMHDVLRDMALYIADHQFMVKAGMQLKELPSEQEWTVSVEKVSLMQNSILKIPPQISPECPHLSTLILEKCGLKRIPESFFKHMSGLKVLNLSANDSLRCLPNSISNLKTLNALILAKCYELTYVPSLAKLRALRKLNLLGTGITEVPHGIETLENLRDLLMGSWALKELPVGISPRNCHLQCLMIEGPFVKGEEVGQLRKLEWVSCSFCNMQEFKKYAECTQGKWPTSFTFQVGPPVRSFLEFQGYPNFKKIEKRVIFRDSEIERCDDRVVPHDLQSLRIEKCDDFKCLNNIPLFRKATDLKEYEIRECEGMACVVDLSLSFCDALHNIEVLKLDLLPNLGEVVRVGVAGEIESTSHAPTPPAIFSSLKEFHMRNCSRVKKLFPVELLQGLQNLEDIGVSDCYEMEEIIASEENQKGEGTTFILPKLKSLWLQDLANLKSICSGGLMTPADSLEELKILKCPKVKRIPLSLPLAENGKPSPPPSLKYISVWPPEWWESVEWDQPDAKHVLSPFVEYSLWSNEMEKRCSIKCLEIMGGRKAPLLNLVINS